MRSSRSSRQFYSVDSDGSCELKPVVGAGFAESHKFVESLLGVFGNVEACFAPIIQMRSKRMDGTSVQRVMQSDVGIRQWRQEKRVFAASFHCRRPNGKFVLFG